MLMEFGHIIYFIILKPIIKILFEASSFKKGIKKAARNQAASNS